MLQHQHSGSAHVLVTTTNKMHRSASVVASVVLQSHTNDTESPCASNPCTWSWCQACHQAPGLTCRFLMSLLSLSASCCAVSSAELNSFTRASDSSSADWVWLYRAWSLADCKPAHKYGERACCPGIDSAAYKSNVAAAAAAALPRAVMQQPISLSDNCS